MMIKKTLTILAVSCMMYSVKQKQKATLSSLNFKPVWCSFFRQRLN